MSEDWGESQGGTELATLRQVHTHKKDERRFQLLVLLVFSVLSVIALIAQAIKPEIVAKDIILTLLPVFTFVLGKGESKNG